MHILKEKIIHMRQEGSSYSELAKKFNISKGTLHYWFKDLPKSAFQLDPEIRKKHLSNIRILAAAARREQRVDRIQAIQSKIDDELKNFPSDNVLLKKAIVSFLYLAEGSKTTSGDFKFTNTDPYLCLLFLTLLRSTFKIDERQIKILLYLHYYHNKKATEDFWSKLLKVPKEQFMKTYIKSRKKTKRKRKNFAGICFIRYGKGAEALRQEVLLLGKTIQDKLLQHVRP